MLLLEGKISVTNKNQVCSDFISFRLVVFDRKKDALFLTVCDDI